MSRTKLFEFVLIFLFCQLLNAQVEKKQESLFEIIQLLEKQFDCHFSYADKTIENVYVEFPDDVGSVEEAVSILKKISNLKITVLKDNFISISKSQNRSSFCGYLLDVDTNEPIVNATLSIADKFTVSDEDGYFEFKDISLNEQLSIHHLGYKRVHYLLSGLNKIDCNPIYLVSKVEQINEIVVRNYLTKGIRISTKGAYDIDYEKFDILPGLIEPDVLQTLQALPGVQSVDETVSNINIRGGAHHENLIMWDGLKMYQSGHFFGLISAFNPYLTKNVTLIKNGTDANYSEGVSGTILMNTSNEIAKDFKTELGLNLVNADFYADIPISSESSIQLSGRKSINNLFKTPTYKQYFDKAFQNSEVVNHSDTNLNTNEEFSFHDINVRWLYNVSPYDKIKVNLLTFGNDLEFSENAVIDDVQESKKSSASQKSSSGGVNYVRIWSDQFLTDFQFYTTQYDLESINYDILNSQRLIQVNEVMEESVKLDSEFKLSDVISLYNGYQYQETGVTNIQDVDNPLFYSKIRQVIRSHGLSSQIGYKSTSGLTNTRLGLRFNYLEKFGYFVLEPRFSLSQRFLNSFTFQVLGEVKHQTATQIVDYHDDFLGIENRRWVLANDGKYEEGGYSIPIVESLKGSLGLFYSNRGWLISAESYFKRIEGITTRSQGFQNQYQYVNAIGNYEVFGADFLVKKTLKNINTWLSYSYVDNEYKFKDLEEANFPSNFDITHAISFGSNYSFRKLDVAAGLNWHSGKPTTKPVEGNEIVDGEINFEVANSDRLEDFMRVDISAKYSFSISKKVGATAGISIWNLLNQENITNNYYRIVDDEVVEIKQTSLKLMPNASFRITF